MFERLAIALLLLAGAMLTPAGASAETTGRVLLVVSGHGLDHGKSQPGFEMDELSQAWLIFRQNGLEVDIASPAGGAVVADEFDPGKPYNRDFLADPEASAELGATQRIDPAMAERYDAVYVIGGKGAMFDLPFNSALQRLIASVHERGGTVAAVCHGPAIFARIRDAGGRSFAQGRRLTGMTDEEEVLFGEHWLPQFPFLLESELRKLGADFTEAPMMLPHVAVDNRVVTGQNPYSVVRSVEAVIESLGRVPAPREAWKDERSMDLVALAAAGDSAPLAQALSENPADLHVPLIAMWGYYRSLQEPSNPAMLDQAIAIMELARPHFAEPQLVEAIAAARARRNGAE